MRQIDGGGKSTHPLGALEADILDLLGLADGPLASLPCYGSRHRVSHELTRAIA